MTKGFVNLKNARNKEQRRLMEKIQKGGFCPFCPKHLEKSELEPVLKNGAYWHLRKNRWPYKSTLVHLVAIHHKHAAKLSDLNPKAFAELLKLFQWAEHKFGAIAGGIGMRFGKPTLNGASVDHLHAHFIVPDPNTKKRGYKTVRMKFGPEPS